MIDSCGDAARAATAALLAELAATPKPGLVDPHQRGAHRDLCARRMTESALALEDVFAAVARSARGHEPSHALREEIGALGRDGERRMLRVTGGVNTHRGALFALGLLVAAAVAPGAAGAQAVATRAARLAALPDRYARRGASHGAGVQHRYGASGALGEARAGFPHAVQVALPLLERGETPADVLLALVARVEDTCVLHRAGTTGLRFAQSGARLASRAGGGRTPTGRLLVRRLNDAFVARGISPGGSADLLAAALFLRGR